MSTVPLPGTQPNKFGFYPVSAFDAAGNLYESQLPFSVNGTSVSTQVVVSKSLNKGKTWLTPVTVESAMSSPDKPLIAIDTTTSAYRNRIYVAYDTNPSGQSQPVVVSRSDDGVTWARTQVADTGADFGASPAIGPEGEVYVIWHAYCGIRPGVCGYPTDILVAKSVDGGSTFAAPGTSPTIVSAANAGFDVVIPNYSNGCGTSPIGVNPAPTLDLDRSGGVHNGNLYVAWADMVQSGSGPMHIYFSRSTDGGATWSTSRQLDTGNLVDGWQPALSVDQTTGAVTVSWYDRRDDPNQKLYRVYYTQSTDGGQTFLSSQRAISSMQSDPTLDCGGTGDYMQMVATDGYAHPFWVDTRNGRNQIFTATLDEATIAQAQMPPARFIGPEKKYAAGPTPTALATGDFNGDGTPAAPAGNGDLRPISFFLGGGKAAFRLNGNNAIGPNP